MKDQVHARLRQAQQRWFPLKDQGLTKHEPKMQGIRELPSGPGRARPGPPALERENL